MRSIDDGLMGHHAGILFHTWKMFFAELIATVYLSNPAALLKMYLITLYILLLYPAWLIHTYPDAISSLTLYVVQNKLKASLQIEPNTTKLVSHALLENDLYSENWDTFLLPPGNLSATEVQFNLQALRVLAIKWAWEILHALIDSGKTRSIALDNMLASLEIGTELVLLIISELTHAEINF